MTSTETFAIELSGVTKRFGSIYANKDASLKVKKGEIHALVGENGAGKSTLMKILYGMYRPDAGEIMVNGKAVALKSPKEAIDLKIGMVHQHFMLVKTLTVAENVVLGEEPVKNGFSLDYARAKEETTRLIKKFNLILDPDALVSGLSVGEEQRLEILKILYRKADILILDEPTAVLTPQEIKYFFDIIRKLSLEGKTIVLITHKLKEVLAISNSVTVMRQGATVARVETAGATESSLAQLMVGRPVIFQVERTLRTKEELEHSDTALSVRKLKAMSSKGHVALNELSLEIKKGEIFGIAGVEGNGQSELIEIITGLNRPVSGSVTALGRDIDFSSNSPRKMFDIGIAHIPEDRHKKGLVLDYSVAENLILGRHREPAFSTPVKMRFAGVDAFAAKMAGDYNIYPPRTDLRAGALSGGNQQKIVVARELSRQPRLMIVSQPTRGVDVGAIEFIHKKIIETRDLGCGVLLISAELPEILSLSDRVGVIYRGQIAGVFGAGEVGEERLGLLMMGGRS
ncbi:MAG: ABC transporter ATP-binding protein [Elusimicrobiota bacterium]